MTEIARNDEVWKPVVGFDAYEVSSLGRLRRCKPDAYGRGLGRILAGVKRSDGYVCYTLHLDRRQEARLGHRIVCEAFHGPRPHPRWHACHSDGNKANNAADNIRWDSPAGNNADKVAHGTLITGDTHRARSNGGYLPRGEAHKQSKLTEQQVRNIRRDSRAQRLIAADHGVTQSLVSQVRSGRIWKHILGEAQ